MRYIILTCIVSWIICLSVFSNAAVGDRPMKAYFPLFSTVQWTHPCRSGEIRHRPGDSFDTPGSSTKTIRWYVCVTSLNGRKWYRGAFGGMSAR